MGIVNRISQVMNFSQTSLENTMDTIKEVHQTIVEIPINVAEEMGLSAEKSAALKAKHRRVLEHLHGGIVGACGEVNRYIVDQAQAVNDLARAQWDPPRPKIVDIDRKSARSVKKRAG